MDLRSASFKVSNFSFQSHVKEVTKQVTDATEAELIFKICHEILQTNVKETPNSKRLKIRAGISQMRSKQITDI